MNNPHAMGELCTLMLYRQLDADVFARWVRRHFGEPGANGELAPRGVMGSEALAKWVATHHLAPHPLDSLRVLEFDQWLMRPEVADGPFTRAMIELRNVFARNANLATPETVSIDSAPFIDVTVEPVSPPPEAKDDPASVLAKLLCAQGRGQATQELSAAFEAYALTAPGNV